MKLFGASRKNQFAPRDISTQQRRSNKKVLWTVIVLVVVGGLLVGAWQYVRTSLFTIDEVVLMENVVVNPDVVPVDQLDKLASSLHGTSLVMLDEKRIEREWSEKFPSVSSMTVQKEYPHSLIVTYIPRVAYSQIVSPDGTFLVDRYGYVFAEASSSALPSLTTEDNVSGVGAETSARGVKLGMYLIEGLRNTEPRLKSMILSGGQLEVKLESDPLILISDDHPPAPTLLQIKTLLAKFKEDKKYPREIDMRYERPVLRY